LLSNYVKVDTLKASSAALQESSFVY